MGTEIALIFGSAPCADWSFLERYRGKVRVICADGGVRLARQAGFRPEVYVGDGDSGGSAGKHMEAVLLPREKNLTDLQAAYEYARDHGFREVILTACTGGRQDHHLTNLMLLEKAAQDGVRMRIVDEENEIRYFTGSGKLRISGFTFFSLVPIDPVLTGVTIQGAKYPLENGTVYRGDSLCVSNEPLDERVSVTVEQGACWLILSGRKKE